MITVSVAALLALTACGAASSDTTGPTGPAPTVAPVTSSPDTTAPVASVPQTSVPVPDTAVDVERPTVVVTYSVLGDLVARLAGDAAEVVVLIPNGLDPHDYEPSAREAEQVMSADLLVVNGLDLEEGLVGLVERASGSGVPVFTVSDHVTLRAMDDAHGDKDDGHGHGHSHGHSHEDDDDEHDHGATDPHFWVDPVTMAEMVPALTLALSVVTEVDLGAAGSALVAELEALHGQVADVMAGLDECLLVTGHESLGYFADRYGCTEIGAVVPGLSSTAEASAGALANLRALAAESGVRAIFTELGTPQRVAEQIAREVGVPVVELSTHLLPDDTGYGGYVLGIAETIVGALTVS
jgi:zinc/manganese transport system substrate-binding protein